MRKRVSRPPRFAAVDNNAIDTIPSVLATGLLTTLIRAKDGDNVTVEGLAQEKTEGREALTKAMRILVDGAYVVKFKVQRAASETVTLEDGTKEQKRGGSWYTTFTVDSIPFNANDVAAMLEEILQAGNVRAVRVEPTRLDPRQDPQATPRPTYGIPSVGATCGNADTGNDQNVKPQVAPTDGEPTVGGPIVGQAAAHIRKKTVSRDSLSPHASGVQSEHPELEQVEDEREAATPKDDHPSGCSETDKVVDSYIAAYMDTAGLPPRPEAIQSVRTAAAALLSVGRSVGNLCTLAAEMGGKGWTDLVRHAQMNPEAAARPAVGRRPWCGECNGGQEPMSAAQRMVETDTGMAKCRCHPGYVPSQPVNA